MSITSTAASNCRRAHDDVLATCLWRVPQRGTNFVSPPAAWTTLRVAHTPHRHHHRQLRLSFINECKGSPWIDLSGISSVAHPASPRLYGRLPPPRRRAPIGAPETET